MKQVKNLLLGDQVALEGDLGQKLNQASAAPVFDASLDYPSGYHVTHLGCIYRFTSDHPAGAWTGNDVVPDVLTSPDAMLDITSAGKLRVVSSDGTIIWMETTAPVSSVNGKVGVVSLDASDVGAATYQQIGIPEFEATSTYAVGKLVAHENAIWKCKTAISTASAWDASKWNKILEFSETESTFPNPVSIGGGSAGVQGAPVFSVKFGTGGAKAVETAQDGKTFFHGIGGYGTAGVTALDLASVVNAKAEKTEIRYNVTTKTPSVSSGTATISLDDRTCNVSATTASVVELVFPLRIADKARDFILALDTSAASSAPSLAYASYMTIVADEDMDLAPVVGFNLYTFTEVSVNTFVATRTTLTTIAERVPQDAEALIDAAQIAGYPVSGVNTPGQLASALGLPASSDFGDCVNKVMLG